MPQNSNYIANLSSYLSYVEYFSLSMEGDGLVVKLVES